jgi:hypothetical protein
MRRFTQSFTKLKGILLVFGVCLSLKKSSRLCVDDFLKWARGLHKLCQARRVFLDFFGLCVNLKVILFLFWCVAPYCLFFFLLLWIYDIEMGGLCELHKVFYVCGKRFTKAPCLYFKKKIFSVCFLWQSLFSFYFVFVSMWVGCFAFWRVEHQKSRRHK